jgi:hypothetical protein
MHISEEVRTAIWQNSAKGTIICHPAKTGGSALGQFYGDILNGAYITMNRLIPWINLAAEKQRIQIENSFVREVNSGKDWAIKFNHQKYSTEELLDFPTSTKVLMPYRNISSRIKSLLAFNYKLYSEMQKSSLIVNFENIDLISSSELSVDSYLGQKLLIEDSEEPKFEYKDLELFAADSFYGSITECEKYLSLLEKGEIEVFLDGIKSDCFLYEDILGDLLSQNEISKLQLARITFIDMADLDLLMFGIHGKHLPKVNNSNYSLLPKLIREKIESKDFEEEIKHRFPNEFFIEKELKARLWRAK